MIAITSCVLFFMTPTDAFPGGSDVEAIDTPQHRPFRRCDCGSPPNRVRVDAWGKLDELYQIEPTKRPGLSCEPLFEPPGYTALTSISWSTSQRASITSTLMA